jgi:beta-lactam-binding protein with PASTA domain
MSTDRSASASFARVPKCVVPKVVGLTLAKAKARIARAYCRVGKVTRKLSSRTKLGKVIGQSPKRGKVLRSGSKVNLTVGRGPRH